MYVPSVLHRVYDVSLFTLHYITLPHLTLSYFSLSCDWVRVWAWALGLGKELGLDQALEFRSLLCPIGEPTIQGRLVSVLVVCGVLGVCQLVDLARGSG